MPIGNITQTMSTISPPPHRGVDVQTVFVNKQEDFQDHLADITIDELNTLKDQLNSRIGEINSTTTTMNGYADTASAGASTATTKAGEASTSASEALTSRNQAETFAQQAKDSAESVDVNNLVHRTGVETIAGIKTFSSSPIVPTPTTDFQVATKKYVDEVRIGLIDYGYVAKSYHIVAFGGEFNRADYPKLWAYLQANPTLLKTQAQWTSEATANGGICGFYSSGDGTTTFRAPNLNSAFLRPSDRGVGSYEADMFKSHAHNYQWTVNSTQISLGVTGLPIPYQQFATSSTGGTETRPKNIAVLPLIVAK